MTHMVMGPAVGAILGDLGADVIKVELLETRQGYKEIWFRLFSHL